MFVCVLQFILSIVQRLTRGYAVLLLAMPQEVLTPA